MNKRFDRRECLRKTAAGLVAGMAAGAGALELAAAEPVERPIRVGVIGVGPRGQYLLRLLTTAVPGVSVPAVCDLNPQSREGAIHLVKQAKGTTPDGYGKDEYDYRNMLQRDDLDAVVVATGVQVLARIAIDAMRTGKHVGAEVTGAHTLEDCWGLVEEKERSGKHYMLLEQCCFGEENLMILNMLAKGLFGEPYYAECSYVHDCRHLLVNPDETLTWRGQLLADGFGSSYSPHGIISVAKWLGINDGDRFVSCNAMMSDPREIHAQMVERFGPEHPLAKTVFRTGDFLSTLIRTAKGKMVRLDYSLSNTRPYSRYYVMQGMNGCYDSRSGVYVRGQSAAEQWDPAAKFLEKHSHPLWRKDAATARATGGHGGMDFFCMRAFADMVRYDREPWVDCYDTAASNVLNHCSQLSIQANGAPVEIPDFTRGKWEDPTWRKDRQTPASVVPT